MPVSLCACVPVCVCVYKAGASSSRLLFRLNSYKNKLSFVQITCMNHIELNVSVTGSIKGK